MAMIQKSLWKLAVVAMTVCVTSCGDENLPGEISDNYILQLTAFIDGKDRLHITQEGFFWEHLDYSAVGLWQGKNEPTIISFYRNKDSLIDRYTWFPNWISEGRPIKKGDLTYSHKIEGIELPSHQFYIELERLSGKGPVEIIQEPSLENNYETIVEFYDSGGGANYYTINLIFHAEPPYKGDFIEKKYSNLIPPPREKAILPVSNNNGSELHVFGVYEGTKEGYEEEKWWEKCTELSIHTCHDYYASTHPEGRVKIVVDAYSKPIILGLSAYDPVHWIIDAPDTVTIEKVILSGYHKQRISGLPDNSLIEVYSQEKYPCDNCSFGKGSFYSYKQPSGNYQRLTGLKPSSFQGKYTGDIFKLSDGILQPNNSQ